jgi:hypothetical protein
MGQKVSFATTNWKDRPNKPNNPADLTQAEWDAQGSSKFSGFPFPVFFAKKWTGGATRRRVLGWGDTYPFFYQFPIQPGWLESLPTDPADGLFYEFQHKYAPFPEVSIPSSAPSGVSLSKIHRPLLIPEFSHLGPFTRSEITRLWWTARELKFTNFSASGSASAHWEGGYGSASSSATGISKTESDARPLEPITSWISAPGGLDFSNISYISPQSKILLDARFEGSNGIFDTTDEACYNNTFFPQNYYEQPYFGDSCNYSYASSSVGASAEFFLGEIYCDIDSPEDFYIAFSLTGSGSVLSGLGEYVRFGPNEGYGASWHTGYQHSFRNITRNSAFNQFYYWSVIIDNFDPANFTYITVGRDGPPNWDYYAIPCPGCITVGTTQFEYFEGRTKSIKYLISSFTVGTDVSSGWYGEAYGSSLSASMPSVPTFSIKVTEYHEYDDGNGNPIYEKTTGEILRDPVTGETV